MNKFFNNPVVNLLRTCFNHKSKFNFMKHKLIFLIIPIVILLSLASFFAYNLFNKKYNIDELFENSKTVIVVPVSSDVDSYRLSKFQQIATNLLNFKCNAQFSEDYNSFVNEILERKAKRVLISTSKNYSVTQQQKEMLLNELKMHFPNLIKIKSIKKIQSFNLNNTQKDSEFWQQIAITMSILVVLMLLYFGLKFRKLGFMSVATVAMFNFIFSAGTLLLFLIILTKKINLTFMIAMSFYFTTNLTVLFHRIKKQVPDLKKINKAKATEVANAAILESLPSAIFIVFTLAAALICSVILYFVFDNLILFYFTLSVVVGVLLDVLFNLFCSGQLWVMLKRKEFNIKNNPPLKKA